VAGHLILGEGEVVEAYAFHVAFSDGVGSGWYLKADVKGK